MLKRKKAEVTAPDWLLCNGFQYCHIALGMTGSHATRKTGERTPGGRTEKEKPRKWQRGVESSMMSVDFQ